jgi:UDP-N-acetylglucosamine--N-acetylmuramyl-(pentapeptide) pyrophosphoryl-undecaprenol N-acetylglucosamine transferase
MAGGTGGHIIPGLTVARHLLAQGWEIYWLGTSDRLEADWVPKAGIDIGFITISGIRGRGITAWLAAPWRIARAVYQAAAIIKRFQPDVALGLGGYVSGPGGLAARLAQIPLVVHEQNAVLGLTNRALAKVATRVLTAFSGTYRGANVVGNPLRECLLQLPPPCERFADRQGPLRLLILGGSQGARLLNQILPAAAALLGSEVIIWHQVGPGAHSRALKAYQASGVQPYQMSELIENMEVAYAWADLVIGRAGALTISELAAVGVAAILVPFQHTDRQQLLNAQILQRAGAASILEESQFTAAQLVQLINRDDREALLQRAIRARAMACRDATQQIASVLQAVIEQQLRRGER